MRQVRDQRGVPRDRVPVGEIRPSQMVYSAGIGAIIDLPKLATMVMGLDEWNVAYCPEVDEARLLAAVQTVLGPSVQTLRLPPSEPDSGLTGGTTDGRVGVPVATFPRWLVCPRCRLIAPISSGYFELRDNLYRKDQIAYVHRGCNKSVRPPDVLPVRFLVACEKGHLDDFPWRVFAHGGPTLCNAPMRLQDFGVSGEAAGIMVHCDCGARQSMSRAFGEDAQSSLPQVCRGRRPHLRDYASEPCDGKIKTILLGASNAWFPLTLSTLYVPPARDTLGQLVAEHWSQLSAIPNKEFLAIYRLMPAANAPLLPFDAYTDDELIVAIEAHRAGASTASEDDPTDIKTPEWRILSRPDPERYGNDFQLTPVAPPVGYESYFEKVVLVDRLREVRALIGFTRIESPGEIYDTQDFPEDQRAPLCRKEPTWVPSTEVRGEGIFLEFKEETITAWLLRQAVQQRDRGFFSAHSQWCRQRGIEPNYRGIGFVLLHSFAHALMRQLVLDCGYAAASIRERLYWPRPGSDKAMAGILLYTAAPDSEGTLGGLVSLGAPHILGDHISQALEMIRLCPSDPLCSEHEPGRSSITVHGAACHACLFVPETSCEASNLYLDRSLLVPTLLRDDLAFFNAVGGS